MRYLSFLFISAAIAFGPALKADSLQSIPGPDDTGGMVMPLVFLNFTTQTVSVNLTQSNTVTMYPLRQYRVWGQYPYAEASFDPALAQEPWYDLLDPSRQHLPFNTQFGFELASGNAHQLPVGSYVYIKASYLSDGLKIYDVGYWADVWGQSGGGGSWIQVFGEGNFGGTLSPALDNVAAWGDASTIKMWHPVALVSEPGIYSARFEIYVGDGYAVPLDGWSAAAIELNWIAASIPEPATAATIAATGCALALGARYRNLRLGAKCRKFPRPA